MFLWDVAVLELDIHPEHNKGPDPRTLHDLCLEVLTVHVNELCLFGAKAFPLLILLMSSI